MEGGGEQLLKGAARRILSVAVLLSSGEVAVQVLEGVGGRERVSAMMEEAIDVAHPMERDPLLLHSARCDPMSERLPLIIDRELPAPKGGLPKGAGEAEAGEAAADRNRPKAGAPPAEMAGSGGREGYGHVRKGGDGGPAIGRAAEAGAEQVAGRPGGEGR